jgi:hypothetical protein
VEQSVLESMNLKQIAEKFEWNVNPPDFINYQTHKFSIIDVIELAASALGTDRTKEIEEIIVGRRGMVVITTLPHTILAGRTPEGFLKEERGHAVLGELGHRRVLYAMAPDMIDKIIVHNFTSQATITVVEKAERLVALSKAKTV